MKTLPKLFFYMNVQFKLIDNYLFHWSSEEVADDFWQVTMMRHHLLFFPRRRRRQSPEVAKAHPWPRQEEKHKLSVEENVHSDLVLYALLRK